MTDIKLFERWVKNALKNKFVFMPYKNFFVVVDGYTGFKIPNKLSSYKKIIKKQTFQNLKRGFVIRDGEIDKWDNLDILEWFDISNKVKAEILPLSYEDGYYKMQIFKTKDELIFVDKQLLKNVNVGNYEIYAESPEKQVIFYSENITYITLPIRMNGFRYTIKENEEEELC
ncbi:nitrate ABC transporter ATP-binding protein [Clostridium sp. CTA-6]